MLTTTTILKCLVPIKKLGRFYCSKPVRVRFAPSPTGYLHLGGLRTALYNFLYAKKHDGTFILRIEDTDQSRKVDGAVEALQEDLEWSGIEINEGPHQGGSFGPYMQSERLEIYKKHIEILLQNGSAYRCFCTDRRLQLIRKEALRAQEIPKYDNKCRHLSSEEVSCRVVKGEPHCIRFKLDKEEEHFRDLIYGHISYNVSVNEGDPVILKSDGYPTYHFANVVDDHLMEVSHVLRGVEWQISTTKHLLLYKAFGWEPPKFGHLPLLMNADGSKLSKRQGDIRIGSYRDSHVFPLALLNFIVISGGGFGKPQLKPQCYTIDQLSQQFDLKKVNSHSGKLMADRLWEFNRLELKRRLNDDGLRKKLIEQTRELAEKHFHGEYNTQLSPDYVEKVLVWAQNRIEKLPDLFTSDLRFVWILPQKYDLNAEISTALRNLRDELSQNEEEITGESLNSLLRRISKENGIKHAVFMKNLRMILSGLKEGPSIGEMVVILGRNDTIKRLDLCLNKLNNNYSILFFFQKIPPEYNYSL